jgi:DNA mismatch repair ATPase MutL
VRGALASAGYVRADTKSDSAELPDSGQWSAAAAGATVEASLGNTEAIRDYQPPVATVPVTQPRIEFGSLGIQEEDFPSEVPASDLPKSDTARDLEAIMRESLAATPVAEVEPNTTATTATVNTGTENTGTAGVPPAPASMPDRSAAPLTLPPLNSAEKFTREVAVESLSNDIRPLGQLDESFIIATDNEGLLLIDQHVAHERVLFDKYRALESARMPESQQLLIPETFDLTPAQAAVFDALAAELENYGFELMRLSGRTVAIKAGPADLPAGEARNMLAELLDTVDAEKKGSARETLRADIAASLACHAAIKVNMPLTREKMVWLIDRLLKTSSPTTCPHGRPVILRLATRDILKGFHRI